MFGYVKYDLAELRIKDLLLYKALYCGLCKGIGESCGSSARIGLSYDVTFLSALLHNLKGEDVKIEQQHCFQHVVKKRPIAVLDPLTEELGALNTVLVYFKLNDDANDKDRSSGRLLWFKKGYKRVKKKYPELVSIVSDYLKEQIETEKSSPSLDAAAEPSAQLMVKLSRHFLGEISSQSSDELFYSVGKWIYLIDALDDFDKDLKKKTFNPFALSFSAKDREELLKENGGELSFLFDTLFFSMREGLGGLKFHFNRDLVDNVILRGIPLETKRVFEGGPPQKMSLKI